MEPILARPEPDVRAAFEALDGQGVQYAFVDTPPAIDVSVAGIVALADLVVIPVRASPDDLRAVGRYGRAGRSIGIHPVKPPIVGDGCERS